MSSVESEIPRVRAHLYERAERALPGVGLGGYALPGHARFVISDARGARLISAEGREYIDYVGGAGANIIGANRPRVVERGVYVPPNVRRFVCPVHEEADFDETLAVLDDAYRRLR